MNNSAIGKVQTSGRLTGIPAVLRVFREQKEDKEYKNNKYKIEDKFIYDYKRGLV
tara:strand:- start:951 stop:1115 length:165 start_codon:yes stop_codon:yes gene_type:complete